MAQALAGALAEEGIATWLDVEQIRFGDSILRRVDEGLASADVFVFFLSRQSINKAWMRAELSGAMVRRLREPDKVKIIPVLIEDVEVPALLRDVLYLDLRDGDVKKAAKRLASTIRDLGRAP
jgi:TIR domain